MDGIVSVWSLCCGERIACFRGHDHIKVAGVLALPNSDIISMGADGAIRIWALIDPVVRGDLRDARDHQGHAEYDAEFDAPVVDAPASAPEGAKSAEPSSPSSSAPIGLSPEDSLLVQPPPPVPTEPLTDEPPATDKDEKGGKDKKASDEHSDDESDLDYDSNADDDILYVCVCVCVCACACVCTFDKMGDLLIHTWSSYTHSYMHAHTQV
jgi:WD40 repeat protein